MRRGVPRWRRYRVAVLGAVLIWTAWPHRTASSAPPAPSQAASAMPAWGGVDLAAFAWSDPAETAALFAELTDGGTLPLAADLERIGGIDGIPLAPKTAPEPGDAGRAVAVERPRRWSGFTALRSDLRDGAPRSRILISQTGPQVRGVAQFVRDGDDRTVGAGYVAVEPGRWRLWAGTIGWHHGFGLICAGPGRWRSLGAAASLAPGRSGPSGTYATARQRTVLGGQIGWYGKSHDGAILAGRRLDAAGRAAPMLWGRLATRGTAHTVALLVGRAGTQTGFSVAATWRRGVGSPAAVRIEADAELAGWRGGNAVTADRRGSFAPLWAARVRVATARWLGEGQIAASRAVTAPPAGARPSVLPQHDGTGWALRSRWRPVAGLAAGVLIAASRVRGAFGGVPEDRGRADLAVELEGRPARGWRVTGAYRWRGTRAAAVSAAEPWAPPRDRQRRDARQIGAHLRHNGSGWSGLIGLRSLSESDGARPRRRNLCEARLEAVVAADCLLRCAWAAAWGGNVDLMAVAAPLPQLSLLRHWGHWRDEVNCGLQCRFRRWLWQAAGALRRPAAAVPDGADAGAVGPSVRWELWLRATRTW